MGFGTYMGFDTYMGFGGLKVRRLIHLPEAIWEPPAARRQGIVASLLGQVISLDRPLSLGLPTHDGLFVHSSSSGRDSEPECRHLLTSDLQILSLAT
jgi:hypothetical protein